MTTPGRSISGLPPRKPQPDASRLIAANRPHPPVEPAATTAKQSDSKGERVKVSVYFAARHRDAARAAFRATAHLEGDGSWSEMVEKAVLAEVERRQRAHNDGQPFDGGGEKLTPGRTITY